MSYINQNSKGVSVFLSVIIMTILLAVAFGISTILIGQIRMIKEMGDSVISFYAADTGVERILYEDKMCRLPGCGSLAWSCVDTIDCDDGRLAGSISDSLGGANYQVIFNNGATVISSRGIYRETRRAVEIRR